mmetsp:Transcript_41116/g.76470  ORF Transcript_41116/g.76470 Transcript_41116/m.76470 type:complete len:223 (+) Transcript_41116:163-831(+)
MWMAVAFRVATVSQSSKYAGKHHKHQPIGPQEPHSLRQLRHSQAGCRADGSLTRQSISWEPVPWPQRSPCQQRVQLHRHRHRHRHHQRRLHSRMRRLTLQRQLHHKLRRQPLCQPQQRHQHRSPWTGFQATALSMVHPTTVEFGALHIVACRCHRHGSGVTHGMLQALHTLASTCSAGVPKSQAAKSLRIFGCPWETCAFEVPRCCRLHRRLSFASVDELAT